MTEQEELYFYFESSIDHLNRAWRILQEIKLHPNHPLVNPAFQFALIEYSKPYKVSYGAELDSKGKPRKLLLDKRYIPAKHSALHDRLIRSRDTTHAHDDLGIKDPAVYVSATPSGKFVGLGQRVIHGTEELSNLDLIIDLIEQTISEMCIESSRLEALLPINSKI
ncbi:MAG: hypothetical protein SF097_00260 [Acidobacteriota bacterium]|nr:hypothetical protein [Acidobacteriota bacterium]